MKKKKLILCPITFLPKIVPLMRQFGKEYRTAGQDTGDNAIRSMRFVCWITKATNTDSEHVIIIAVPH